MSVRGPITQRFTASLRRFSRDFVKEEKKEVREAGEKK